MEKSPESNPENEIDRVFRSAGALIGTNKELTLLRIGPDTTVLATGVDNLRTALFELKIGIRRTSHDFFRSEIPSPAEVEDAINFIEDELMKASALAESPSELITFDAGIRSIAAEAGVEDEVYLGRQAMEELFTRYALISLGRPEAFDTLKMDREFFANLLILREVMHHLGFERIRIVA
jgi:exopolyphosphatase/pppGpp-phosphohydrolase